MPPQKESCVAHSETGVVTKEEKVVRESQHYHSRSLHRSLLGRSSLSKKQPRAM